MSKIVVYGVDESPPVRACLLTLKALELPFEYKVVDLAGGENRSPEYLKLNPLGTVPVLDDKGTVIYDSHAICSYLCDKYAKTDALYPKDLVKRAGVNQRLFFDASVIYRSVWNVAIGFWRSGHTVVEKEKVDNIHDALRQTELLLEKSYIAGDTLTIADLCCAPTVSAVAVAVDLNADRYPKITAWLARLGQLPYFEEFNNVGAKRYTDFMRSKWTKIEE
ncbi:glutathione S-transferase 1 [Drosophila grimshawi]|uniref:GH13569 n=1 Tax=Drosophila grimshawi TaxID=7222 RepID=B4JPR8_DROGR|nr:glutathione S-transferase 1 [Drosophila grimshawi]EDV98898.1 GH13569 [Drosophila grimshawi]